MDRKCFSMPCENYEKGMVAQVFFRSFIESVLRSRDNGSGLRPAYI